MRKKKPTPTVSVVQRGKSSFRVRTRWRDPETGQIREVNETVRGTREYAEAYRRKIIDKFATGELTQLSAESVGKFLDDHFTYRTAVGDIKESSEQTYRSMLKNFTDQYGDTPLVNLRPDHIRSWMMQMVATKGASATRYTASILRSALKEAVRQGVLISNPFDRIPLPKPEEKRKTTTLNVDQVRSIPVNDETFFVRFLLETGLRRGELAALQWSDITPHGVVKVRKTAVRLRGGKITTWTPKTKTSIRDIPVRPVMRDELNDRRGEPDTYVWSGTRDVPDPEAVSDGIERVMESYGIRGFTAHDLRHAHATHLLRQKLPPAAVSRRLGHSKTSITLDQYSHALQDDDRAILAALDQMLD